MNFPLVIFIFFLIIMIITGFLFCYQLHVLIFNIDVLNVML